MGIKWYLSDGLIRGSQTGISKSTFSSIFLSNTGLGQFLRKKIINLTTQIYVLSSTEKFKNTIFYQVLKTKKNFCTITPATALGYN